MSALSIILDIILILISIVLIISVLMQQGQRQGLGAIAGGAETFFGKNKSKGIDAKLAKITKFAAIVFIVLAIATTIVVSHNAKNDPAADLNSIVQEATDLANEQVVGENATDAPADEATDAPAAEATDEPAAEATAEPAKAE